MGVPNEGEALLVLVVVLVVLAEVVFDVVEVLIVCWFEVAMMGDGLVRGIDECIVLRNVVSPRPKLLRYLGMGRVILALFVFVVFTGLPGAMNVCTAGGRFWFKDDNSNGFGCIMGTVAVGCWPEPLRIQSLENPRWSVVDCSNSIAREKISVEASEPP